MKDCVVLILIFMKGGVCSSHSRIFHSFGDVTIIGEGLQIWTFTRHSWPLSSASSFITGHTYCDTGQPFIMVISGKTRDAHTCCRMFSSGAVTTCYKVLVRPRIESRSPACEAVVLNEAGNDLFRERHHLYYSVLYFRPLWANLKRG